MRLTTDAFGEHDAPVVFGWVVARHQVVAATTAFMAGVLRVQLVSYPTPFVIAGATGVMAAFLALRSRRRDDSVPLQLANENG